MGSPAVEASSGRLFVVSQSDGVLHGLRLRDGKGVWKSAKTNRCDGSPATADGRIAYGNCDASLYAFATESGAPLGSLALGDDSQVAGGVALSGNQAFFGSRSGRVFCADLKAMRLVWTNTACAGEVFSTPAVNGKLVVFGSASGHVYGVDRASGRLLWTHETSNPASSPALLADGVLVSAGGKLYALSDADGRVKAVRELSDRITAPAVVGPLAVVGADNGVVSAFRLSSTASSTP
jgi:outer membrane protein assembly factor BamB